MSDSDRNPENVTSEPVQSPEAESQTANTPVEKCNPTLPCDEVDRPSSKIPDFNARGLLPAGIHGASDAEFKERFVDAYGISSRRNMIWNKHSEWRARVHELGFKGVFWLDGSFVEDKIDPGDIDVATVLDYDSYNKMSVAAQYFAEKWMDYGRGQDRYETDGRLVFTCPEGHPRKAFIDDLYRRILDLYTHTKGGIEKGIVATQFASGERSLESEP